MSFNNPANQALHKNHDVIFGISISPASTFLIFLAIFFLNFSHTCVSGHLLFQIYLK